MYPSALHVRWELPTWAIASHGLPPAVAALAVDNEPSVFWDGGTAASRAALIDDWRDAVGFRNGDGPGEWGTVSDGVGNGSSGRGVTRAVLEPLRIDPDEVWFTDSVTRFFVKRSGNPKARQQGDVLDDVYAPFAAAVGLEPATLPSRPPPRALVEHAAREERQRLRDELTAAGPDLVITLGEEARLVMAAIADEASGPGVRSLSSSDPEYGGASTLRLDDSNLRWYALVHPGQRSPAWDAARKAWAERHRQVSS